MRSLLFYGGVFVPNMLFSLLFFLVLVLVQVQHAKADNEQQLSVS